MSTLKITDLKKSLKQLEHKELIVLVAELYKINKVVKDYLSIQFGGEEELMELQEKAKNKIKNEFFPDRGMPKMRLSEAKKVIIDFKKVAGNSHLVVDLMLFYVEMGTEFTSTYGDIDSKFYDSMLSTYDKVANECGKNEELFSSLKERLYSCVSMSEGIGWGYHDGLCDIYYSISWVMDEEED